VVGSDPEKFARLAEETGLPEDRQSSCQGDFSNAEWSCTEYIDRSAMSNLDDMQSFQGGRL
jgi:hypothetical protein